ncbi:hypothetical protein Tco_0438732 [Tanacetum coccineum]
MDAPLLRDRVFDFPTVEPEPHPAYDFFVAELVPGLAEAPGGTEEAKLDLLFGDDTDDDDNEDDWESDDEWLMAHVTLPSTYEVGGPSTTTPGGLVKKMGTVSDAPVADSIAVGEIWPRVTTVERQERLAVLEKKLLGPLPGPQ